MQNERKRQEVFVHPELKKEISEELETTTQTVMMALKFVNNSELGLSIRRLAKQKLMTEANKVNC